jgi:hypothetical protein
VDALKELLEKSPAEARTHWEKFVELAREAWPRGKGDWGDLELTVANLCGYPDYDPTGEPDDEPDEEPIVIPGLPEQEPHPEPGTAAYDAVLERARPDEAWLKQVSKTAATLGKTEVVKGLAQLYRAAMKSGIGSLNRKTPNRQVLGGLLWCALAVPEAEPAVALGQLAAWSLEHNTAQGRIIGIILASMASEDAAGALRLIELGAKRQSARERFGRFASHVERKVGITPEISAERYVPTLGLNVSGQLRTEFPGAGAVGLAIEGSKVVLRIFNAAGKPAASVPAAMKRAHGTKVKELRDTAKGLGKLLLAQRNRLENLMLEPRAWEFEKWRELYLRHPVVGSLARRLIWTVNGVPLIFGAGEPQDVRGQCAGVATSAKVELWHPLGQAVDAVVAWRERLAVLKLTQPFKQAHRELYLLTDAERTTATYSNRFAGHILRQQQFRALAPARKWRAPFLGGFDGGDAGIAQRTLPEGWRIEFWVNMADQRLSPTGASFLYIGTDQVRFYRGATGHEPAPLEQVPARIFSEAMRDVDLFVGVASVGNDPAWRDSGDGARHRHYWGRFAFGELGATARTRREVLQRLIPRLRIAAVCSFTDRFLVVRGLLHTYRIHLGSGNILMAPNDQYLCIVADCRSAIQNEEVFLPFEGDSTLSLILSKAFLLAEDWKITDASILRQIKDG